MTEWFIEFEPYYLTIGMTHDQYWNDDPWLVWTYRDAHKKRLDMRSQEMWLQGLYNFHAFSTALGNFGNALGGKKRKKNAFEYMKEPIKITPLSDGEKRAKEREEARKELLMWKAMERQWVQENEE